MSDLLSIGASGVRANQAALATVSENIANAGVAGFSRRTVTTREIAAAGGGLTESGGLAGYGVLVTGTSRAADMFKAAAVRDSGADLARTEAGSVWLERIQSALTGSDLGTRLTSFFTAARGVAADPASLAPRAVMLENAASVAAAFATTGDALARAAAELDATADQAVGNLGTLASALAKINDGLGRATPGTAGAANLADQRDALLEQMSALTDVTATFDAAGRATVRAGGSNGPTLVTATGAATIGYSRNGEGAVSFAVSLGGDVSVLTPAGGALGGIVDGSQRIADARASLNELAGNFVAGVNQVQAQGGDLSASAGAALFATGDTPTDIRLALDDPAGIAAAAVGEGTRGNGNLAALESLRSARGFESGVTTLVATNAAAISSRATVAQAQSAIHDGAITARDAVSGVDLDREAVDLLRFQQAYQASSRVIQVARETLQTLLDIR